MQVLKQLAELWERAVCLHILLVGVPDASGWPRWGGKQDVRTEKLIQQGLSYVLKEITWFFLPYKGFHASKKYACPDINRSWSNNASSSLHPSMPRRLGFQFLIYVTLCLYPSEGIKRAHTWLYYSLVYSLFTIALQGRFDNLPKIMSRPTCGSWTTTWEPLC